MDKLLEKYGLSYSDLSSAEKETYQSWLQSLEVNEITVDKVREYIMAMKEVVEQELTQTSHNSTQDVFLKARLRNYVLLEGFLSSPEKARKAIELQLSRLTRKI